MRYSLIISTLLLFTACSIDKASIDPTGYAATSPFLPWISAKAKHLPAPPPVHIAVELPDSTEELNLAHIIDVALKNNASTKNTWANARSAAAAYGQSQSGCFPTISGDWSYIRSRFASILPGIPGAIYYQGQWGPQLSLSYTILDFGKQKATTESALQSLYYADLSHNRELQTVIQTVTDDYYNLLYQKELKKANEEDVKTAKTTYDATEEGLRTGVNDKSDVLQAKTQMLQAQLTLTAQDQSVVVAYATLLTDMGVPASTALTLDSFPTKLPEKLDLPESEQLTQVAFDQRPDLLAAVADVKSKDENIKLARTQNFPTVNYNLNVGRTFYSEGFNDQYDFTGTFNVSLPIFAGFYYKNNVRSAVAKKEQSEANLLKLKLSVVEDVTTSYSNVKISFENLKLSEEFLESAALQYDVMLKKFKVQATSILDLLSAQSALADARAERSLALRNWFSSLVDLAYATGTLQIIKEKSP